jgi:hypothetical protein
MDGKVILAGAIAFATLMAAWMYRYEAYGAYNASHRTDLQAQPLGGRGGIRTHGTLAGTPVFKTGALNHSATLPAQEF